MTAPKMKAKAEALQQKSPAEFFAENKNIAGFDNVVFPASTSALAVYSWSYWRVV